MDLVIKGKNIDVPENAKEYINKKAGKLDRHLQDISKAKVEISEEKTRSKDNRYIVEVTIDTQGTFLRGEQRGPDIFSAADAVADMMDRQIRRYKERLQGKKRRITPLKEAAPVADIEDADTDQDEDESEGTLIKVKHFPIKPMSIEKAMDQMDWLGHDFFFFFNAESEKFNVLYRRRRGDFGLIEPEMD
ncbi:MAG: ribosome-associated translation inhibitor RaiA [Chloroflexota bacterium]|nr:ribosome-associated translation inhibitor RaiA [Chloroflexota bacterium]